MSDDSTPLPYLEKANMFLYEYMFMEINKDLKQSEDVAFLTFALINRVMRKLKLPMTELLIFTCIRLASKFAQKDDHQLSFSDLKFHSTHSEIFKDLSDECTSHG